MIFIVVRTFFYTFFTHPIKSYSFRVRYVGLVLFCLFLKIFLRFRVPNRRDDDVEHAWNDIIRSPRYEIVRLTRTADTSQASRFSNRYDGFMITEPSSTPYGGLVVNFFFTDTSLDANFFISRVLRRTSVHNNLRI